ncbi:hypothetical protein KDM87_15755 [Undibacterium sp. FT147W]|uniref:NolW-like domain-containing protein n=1 Tax=Undibacterium rivi TaxID=2828729 RepID=A0ABS5H582_9BURK|nr:type II secretion system protein GspD [Undibacterium rivi]MBR7794048.1 hypothetical protein [Undibacterium rivi]
MKKFPFGRQGNKSLYGALPVSALGLMLALSGCADTKLLVPKRIDFERSPQTDTASLLGDQQMKRTYSETDTPKMPATISGEKRAAQDQPAPAGGKADLTVSFDQMPLPTFIQAVYGSVLKANYSMDGAVAARTDLVTFHIPQPTTNAELSRLSRMLLKSYGVAVQDFGGVIRMVPDNASSSYSPAIRRGRASPETPQSLRPVFHYVELDAVRVNDFSSLLKTMFGAKIQATDDLGKNAILISGQPDDVAAAMEVIQVFDQPAMRGQRTKRVSPVFWTAEEFSKRLVEVLSAEGYAASTSVNSGSPILILPIPPINSVIIFSSSEKILNHVLQWSKELDKPSESQAGGAFFTYPVKYADAQALAKTLSELIGGSTSSTVPAATGTAATAAATAAASGNRGGSKIVVNNATNSLIIQGGGADQYRQWMALLAELDKPSKSALIDVMVAEVTAGTSNSLGVDWSVKNGTPLSGTLPISKLGSSGLAFSFLNSAHSMRADVTALASKSDAQILSSPKLMARNGETATIQVADEVPILTSTTTTPGVLTGSTTTNTVQYRTAGMILKVRPIINSGSRIDLDISQEVSNVKSLTSGAITSPTIGTRKVDTKLTLRDGSTVMLAGLISNDNNSSDGGVPLLKDIPGIGSLFKNESMNKNKKELIILITPYIINDDFEAESITNAFQSTLGDWARDLKSNADMNRLRRSTNPENTKSAVEFSAPVRDTKLVNPNTEVMSAPGSQEVAPTPAESSATTPMAPAKDAPKKPDADELGGVIMSKPVPAPVQNPASTTSAAGQEKAGAKTAAKPAPVNKPSNVVMPPIPGAKLVEDPELLEELRRAAGLPKR